MPRDMTFQALKLLSQYIVSNKDKIPEGEIFQKTSCMNSDDAELCGMLLAMADRIQARNPTRAERLRSIETLVEKIGISKWIHGELTHLGFRAGTRYEDVSDVAQDSEQAAESIIDVIDEASIDESADKTET